MPGRWMTQPAPGHGLPREISESDATAPARRGMQWRMMEAGSSPYCQQDRSRESSRVLSSGQTPETIRPVVHSETSCPSVIR